MAKLGKIGLATATGGLSLMGDKLFGGGGGSAPSVDPRLIENAGRMSTIGRDSYAWNLGEAQRLQPMYRDLAQTGQGIVSGAAGRFGQIGEQYDTTFAPINERVASDAMNFDSPAELDRVSGQALSDTNTAFGQARGRMGAYFAKYGMNPANFASQNYLMNLEQARAGAGGMNRAREDRRLGGIQLRTGAANLGRGILSDATGQGGLTLSGATTTGGIASEGMDVYNRGTTSALPWFTGANSAFLGKTGSDMNAYQTDQNAQASKWAGIGQLAGTIGGFAIGGPVGAAVGSQLGAGIGKSAAPSAAGTPFGYSYPK